MSEESVDVLIVGGGAAGAAMAWSLAETRMKILCLEQGDWMDPGQYPSTRKDWELRRFGDFAFSPNDRGRVEDYPVNDGDSPISISNFNAVGGSTILYAAHFPRFHPSDFKVRTLDGVADDWPLDYWSSGGTGGPPTARSPPASTRAAPPASTWGPASWAAPRERRPAPTSPTGPPP
jgi:choline dehydrogenase-like flavoprotein